MVLTDMPDALELLTQNAQRSGSSAVSVAPCAWGDQGHVRALTASGAYDVVLCCECVYQQSEEVLRALAETQQALAEPSAGKVLVAYEFREGLVEDLAYFDAATERFGDSDSYPLEGDLSTSSAHADDGDQHRFLYVYAARPKR